MNPTSIVRTNLTASHSTHPARPVRSLFNERLQWQSGGAPRASEHRLRHTFDRAAVGLSHIGLDGRWLMVNRKLCELVGYGRQELLEMNAIQITHPDDQADSLDCLRQIQSGEITECSRVKRYLHRNGSVVWVKVSVTLGLSQGGRERHCITVVEDISRIKQLERELRTLVGHDALTGLPNRSQLQERLGRALEESRGSGRMVAVLLIDLDRFKNINDTLGHEVGDKLLVETGQRLAASVLEGETAARLGGDEFVLVLPNLERAEDATLLARQAMAALAAPIQIDGREFYPTASVGISLFPRDGADGATLLMNADIAMYRAKAHGRNTFRFYMPEMNARSLHRLTLETDLRHALERREFVLHYQPQLDIASGRVIGVEALLRWQRPGAGMVPPGDFIPIAEESGLIVPIGEWVLRTACAQSRAWLEAGLPPLKMAVNLSARQFQRQGLEAMVAQILHETGCPAGALELEITESVIMDSPELAVETLRRLSAMGVQLSVDDFGTGYSSLSYLKRFPIHSLKIDQSFVRDITTDGDDAAIANAVIVLAHSLKLTVVAEGVETREQLEHLRGQRCDQMQGYHFSRPLAAPQMEELLRSGRGLDGAAGLGGPGGLGAIGGQGAQSGNLPYPDASQLF